MVAKTSAELEVWNWGEPRRMVLKEIKESMKCTCPEFNENLTKDRKDWWESWTASVDKAFSHQNYFPFYIAKEKADFLKTCI